MKSKNQIYQLRRNLPIWKCKRQIIELINSNSVVIIIGETGCGKSTQVPQFLIDSNELYGSNIAITQPRRVSAVSLAKRVAYERHCDVGKQVGFNVRFDNQSTPRTRIKYLTDGMLLREILADPDLSTYNIVILDEIHERTVQTDLLIGLLRTLQQRRPDLKIVLMSATLQCQTFVDFFDNPPIIQVAGRMYPVAVFYTDEPQTDWVEACSTSILQLNQELDLGDFLVFMTGQEEIEEVCSLLRSKNVNPPLVVLPLYAALPLYEQQKVFDETLPGHRKVILATNIAETSLTISGIRYVIDAGLAKVKTFSPATGIEVLCTEPIAKAQAMQRMGRAGREAPGACFRLYTEERYLSFEDSPTPEIKRADLSSVVLQLMAIGAGDPRTFAFLQRPSDSLLKASIESLAELGAITISGPTAFDSTLTLTDDGIKMAKFPLSPKMSKILLLAGENGVGGSALTLMAMMSAENIFFYPAAQRQKARRQHELFVDQTGDHLTLLRIYEEYINSNDRHKFCMKNFLSERALEYAVKVREQLAQTAVEEKILLDSTDQEQRNPDEINDEDVSIEEQKILSIQKGEKLRKCMVLAMRENVAILSGTQSYRCMDGTEISIHPSSFAFQKGMKCIVFTERAKTKKLYARWVSEANEKWLHDV